MLHIPLSSLGWLFSFVIWLVPGFIWSTMSDRVLPALASFAISLFCLAVFVFIVALPLFKP